LCPLCLCGFLNLSNIEQKSEPDQVYYLIDTLQLSSVGSPDYQYGQETILNKLSIMRRANGDLFTLMRKGREFLAVWSSLESATQYKVRNPELIVFVPITVASPFVQKRLGLLQEEGIGLFLLADTKVALLKDGRNMRWDEME
jgi:hypothetical protein